MDLRKLVNPDQAREDEFGHRGKRLGPGLYWAAFGDSGYRRNVVRGLLILGAIIGIRVIAS